jgi:hypothetical protein
MSINAIRITTTAMIDKMETYRKNAPVLPRSRIPEKAKIKLCMSMMKQAGCHLCARRRTPCQNVARQGNFQATLIEQTPNASPSC